ncbi:MAG: ABC transporter substrate-binding protein [Helicobacteraceae bacterium]|jgi:iron complex transport system substrate-binding protein|nr:ABC transporter substrate-binding protein [Helicobacteraceae bacterium]
MKKSLILALLASLCFAIEITDMTGTKVQLQKPPLKVYAPMPYGSYILYAMDSDLLSALVFAPSEEAKDLLKPRMYTLPVVGSISGDGPNTNLEALLAQKPDLILMWSSSQKLRQGSIDERIVKMNIPVAYAVAENFEDYPKVFRFLGELLDRKERGEKLAAHFEKTIAAVKAVVAKSKTKPKVYYAEGVDGLTSECDDSIHVELLKTLGDLNVHRCTTTSHKGFEKVTIEQILLYNPDVIVAQEKKFVDSVFSDPKWKTIAAVKNKQVYLIPKLPFNWFDRPPSFMRLIGLQWLANILYPNEYPLDLVAETKAFYLEFLGVKLSDAQLARILTPQSIRRSK